ncbi:phosphoglucosamine mutase [Thiosulfativibrio zosterae]|uniref:Phosphoglucosamine mutase n=1 Tax=Thiosulfativibrio zosterae TaxID=2675053 RepID=A0A6F8PPB5_9GAMM|nr:phosphoglucosamine mutase [Thiosulfativibrio zosterae]BBP43945.1 phosphoglucosamine mutase [Thiosulfativibrio zosterae]
MKKKYFGTDGIRNRVGKGMIRPDQILKLGWATGKVIKKHGEKSVLIGKDTRISGYMFESALEAGFISAGIDVYLVGPMPTPAIAYLTQTFHCDAGIVISASHNPHYDNGIKFFSAKGLKISDEIELEVESAFEGEIETVSSELLGKARRIDDAAGRYIEFCKSTYHAQRKLDGFKIVLDCANGATYHVAPSVFQELGAEVIEMGVSPNGLNINLGCGATDLAALQQKVLSSSADLGIAYDGDGDRVMMVSGSGRILDGDALLYLLAVYAKKPVRGVVGTLMTNMGLENALKEKNIDFVRTQVGDRYVMEALMARDWQLGAESSGHVLSLDKTTTGDGIIASLQVMAIIVNQSKTLDELIAPMQVYPQVLINVHVKDKSGFERNQALRAAVEQVEAEMLGKGRVLLRASGTESLIRVMIEGEDAKLIQNLAERLAKLVETEFS